MGIGDTAKTLGLSAPTVSKAIEQLETLGIVQKTSERQRNRLWVYTSYLALLAQGTEPLLR
jgi:DNA-binding transcriptional regulator GbsR (MarR family)